MTLLYDEQEIMKSYVESEVYEATQEARRDEKEETAREMLQNGEPIEKIIKYSRLPKETILKIQKGLML